jgi:hypothetical protein
MKQFLFAIASAVSIATGTPAASGGQPPGPPGVRQRLVPEVACIIQTDETHFRAFFGYSNAAESSVTIPTGKRNQFIPGPADQGQPEVFAPGRTPVAFSVPFDGSDLAWKLGSRRAIASLATTPCTSSNPNDLTSGATTDKGAGPVVISEDDVLAFEPPPPVEIPSAQDKGNQVPVVPPIEAPGVPDGATSGPEDQPLPQSELPKVSASAVGDFASTGFPADAQIATSRTHIIVSGARAIAFYQRNLLGTPVNPTDENAPTQLQFTGVNAIFAGLITSVNNAGITLQGATSGNVNPLGAYFDTRVLYDSFRSRFFITVLVNTTNSTFPTLTMTAVSVDENPMNGFFTYWWHAVVPEIFRTGDAGDYPSIGISGDLFVETVNVGRANGTQEHLVNLFSVDDMATGLPYNSLRGWRYWSLVNADNRNIGATVVQPTVQHSNDNVHFLVNHEGTARRLQIWRISNLNPFVAGQQRLEVAAVDLLSDFASPVEGQDDMASCQVPLGPIVVTVTCRIQFTNLGNDVLKASYRAGQLYMTMQDARDWDRNGVIYTSVRLVRMGVQGYPSLPQSNITIDRTFGSANVIEDQPDTPALRFHYGWPAVEANAQGDIVVMYARTGQTINPEARYSVRLAADPDMRPSRVLKVGDAPYMITYPNVLQSGLFRWGDTAGASVDPIDDTGIWIAQQYATATATNQNGNFGIWIGKVFGF